MTSISNSGTASAALAALGVNNGRIDIRINCNIDTKFYTGDGNGVGDSLGTILGIQGTEYSIKTVDEISITSGYNEGDGGYTDGEQYRSYRQNLLDQGKINMWGRGMAIVGNKVIDPQYGEIADVVAINGNPVSQTISHEIGVVDATAPTNQEQLLMNTVTKFDDTTVAVNQGDKLLILKDFNKDGKVDTIFVASQNAEEIRTGSLGGNDGKVVLSGAHGDPHLRQTVYEGAQVANLKGSMDALYADAQDGTINSQANVDIAFGAALNDGKKIEVGDAHDDFTLKNGTVKAEVDVKKAGYVAYTENVKIDFGDGKEYTALNIWKENANDGAIGVRVATSGDGGQSKATFVNVTKSNGAELGVEGTHLVLDSRTKGKYVLDANGKLDTSALNFSLNFAQQEIHRTQYNVLPTLYYRPKDEYPSERRISPNPPLVPRPPTKPVDPVVNLPIDNPAPGNSVEDQIKSFYLNYLHRAPDQEGFNYWVDQVKTNKMTLVQVSNAIQFSPEAKVYGFYLQYLKREPDAAGLAYWRDQIRDGKMTQDQVENAIKNSDEAKKVK